MAEAAKLDIIGISKDYKGVVALKPTDLTVQKGEFLTLLGPSGSGKTTLLMMIAGLTEPSGGLVKVDGTDVTDLPAYRRNLGVVFQSYALFPHMTVADNVGYPLRMRRLPKAEISAAVREALAIVQLEKLANRLPAELSGGQQQRVAFARAIAFKPALVLMDEPLGALDKRLRDELKREIRRLHRELGTTIIYVTHDQDEAMMLSDRICLMNQAQVVQVDTPAMLYNRPNSRFAAEFLGESNLFPATIGRTETGRVELSVAQGAVKFWSTDPALLRNADAAEVLIRPERIRIVGRGDTTVNGFLEAEVTSTLDFGEVHRIYCKLADGMEVHVAALGRTEMPARVGDRVRLGVDEADLVLLPTSGRTVPRL